MNCEKRGEKREKKWFFYLLMGHLRAMLHFKLKLLSTMFMVYSDNIIIVLRSLFYNTVDALSRPRV